MSSRSLIIFLTGMHVSFAYNSYIDVNDAMYRYRNNKLDDRDKKKYYNEELYVKHRVFQEFPLNLLMASIWHVTLPLSFIQSIARFINPPNQ